MERSRSDRELLSKRRGEPADGSASPIPIDVTRFTRVTLLHAGSEPMSPIRILVDADACPVKDEIYKVAWRREVPVTVVSNQRIRVPDHPLIDRVLVSDKFDAADDWIVEAADAKSVVITGDILLADRCLKQGATVIGHNGKPFTAASIGGAIATRAIMADLRAGGDVVGGPKPFAKADRSRFLQALDEALVILGRSV
jgi:uncharacterized protein YaiI (UPF0178 family)